MVPLNDTTNGAEIAHFPFVQHLYKTQNPVNREKQSQQREECV